MNQKTWTIDNRLLKLDFWISEFVILLLSNYFRWMDEWNRMGVCVVAVIFIVTIQYGLLHTKSMILRKTYKWYHILFVELCYLLSMIFILIGNVFWFKESSQIHFAFIGVLALLLAPTIGSYGSDVFCSGITKNPHSKECGFFYPSRRLGISSPREAWCISSAPAGLYLITRQRASYLRLDDIQTFGLMIYRNKLRMIYTPSA